jgi:hypothetical protein
MTNRAGIICRTFGYIDHIIQTTTVIHHPLVSRYSGAAKAHF